MPVGRGDLGLAPRGGPGRLRGEGWIRQRPQGRLADLADGLGRRRRHDVGHPPKVGRLEADVEVGSQWPGHLLPEEGAHRLAGDPANDLADQIPLGHGVVARHGAGLPPGLLGREQGGGFLPVIKVLDRHRFGPAWQPGGVAQDVAEQNTSLLATRPELRPVAGHRRVEVELAGVDQHQGAQGGHGLGGRPDVGDGVALPRHGAGGVDPAAPDVDDQFVVEHDRNRRSEIGVAGQAGGEEISHDGEPLVADAMDLGRLRRRGGFGSGHGANATGALARRKPLRPGSAMATAAGHSNHRTSWLSPSGGAGSSSPRTASR